MSDTKPRAFTKKYGSRKEVFDGVACMTRGGLSIEDLFVDGDGVIRSLKQQESLKKSQDNLVRKEKKVKVPDLGKAVQSDDDSEISNHSDGGADVTKRTKAVPTKALNICDIKDAVAETLSENNDKLPRGHSKWKKEQWLEKARQLQLVQ
jgi:hypothetical protein